MTTSDFREIYDCAESVVALRAASMLPWQFTSLVIEFTNGELALDCDADTDELNFEWRSSASATLPKIEALELLVDSRLEMAWQMLNHRGYWDAAQLKFLHPNRENTTLQFEVLASAIEIRRVGDIP